MLYNNNYTKHVDTKYELMWHAGSIPAISTTILRTENMAEKLMFSALRAKAEAEKLEGLATLDVYVRNAAGIGEHPQVVEEAYEALKKVDNANSILETLEKITSSNDKQQE